MPTRRREQNQRLFREVNEWMREAGDDFGLRGDTVLDFVCECGDAACTDRLRLTLTEYGKLPRDGPHFVVRPRHERSGQRVVERTGKYVLVEDHAAVSKPHPA
jgi:hypothetical protein